MCQLLRRDHMPHLWDRLHKICQHSDAAVMSQVPCKLLPAGQHMCAVLTSCQTDNFCRKPDLPTVSLRHKLWWGKEGMQRQGHPKSSQRCESPRSPTLAYPFSNKNHRCWKWINNDDRTHIHLSFFGACMLELWQVKNERNRTWKSWCNQTARIEIFSS